MEAKAQTLQDEGQTVIFVAINDRAAGILAVADPIKKSTPEALRELRRMGLKVIMLTGDNERTAQAVAKKLGIDQVEAGVAPKDKHERIKQLREHAVVAMAGDGINDAPALAAADVGIAMGTGTDVAMESAGITLVKGDLDGIVKAIHLSKAVMRNIRQNLFFAFVYNALGIPIAAGLLYPFFGLLLSPIIAGAAMSLSSVSVIANALRLRNAAVVAAYCRSRCSTENHLTIEPMNIRYPGRFRLRLPSPLSRLGRRSTRQNDGAFRDSKRGQANSHREG